MHDDFETGAEHDTFNSNDPDRDRETSQNARAPEKKSADTRKRGEEDRRDAPRHPRA